MEAPQPQPTPSPIPSRPGRWRLQLGWALQAPVALVRWLFGRVPLYRRNRSRPQRPQPPDFDRPLPGDPSILQRPGDGVGPVYNRRYWIDLTDTACSPEGLIDLVAHNLDALAPSELARFESNAGADVAQLGLDVGDELVVRLPGPWDGPVRVIDRTPTSFRFATLRGHVEAGEIEFRAGRTERGFLRFEIESWARSATPAVHVLYDRFSIAREMQTQMWAQLCKRTARMAHGVVMSNVQVQTSRSEPV